MPIFPPVEWIVPNGGDRPSFSRDGAEVVYENGASLFIVASSGGESRLLLTGTSELMPSRADWSWSPFTIAFGGANRKTSASTIWLIDCDGANLRELPNRGGLTQSTYPSWDEDLRTIVAIDAGDPQFLALWRFSVDGSADPVQLTTTDDFCAGRPSAAPGRPSGPGAGARRPSSRGSSTRGRDARRTGRRTASGSSSSRTASPAAITSSSSRRRPARACRRWRRARSRSRS